MIVGSLLLFFACAPGLYLIFAYTHANFWWFLVGFLMCLFAQTVLLSLFCAFKLQKAYRDSGSIKLSKNAKLNPEEEYPFIQIDEPQQLFFNKFTQEARFFQKRNTLKAAKIQNYFQEETEINDEIRTATMHFLKQFKGYYNTLNRFNQSLVDFGKNLFRIQDHSMFIKRKYHFPIFERDHCSQISLSQLIDEDKELIQRTHIKLKVKKDSQVIILPSWELVVRCFRFIGTQFERIQDMRLSNSEMLEMIGKKVLDDYQFIEDQIIHLRKSLEQTRERLQKLNAQHDIYQKEEMNLNALNQPHLDMMIWLRRQVYEFKDLERRIRENQNSFKEQTQKLKYYKEKLASFLDQNKRKYLKILKTRFIAFLDSYYITIDESIEKIRTIFNYNHNHQQHRPPKVNKLKTSKNMNQSLEAEKVYQKQYFARVDFYRNKLSGIIYSLSSLSQFLCFLKKILQIIIDNLKDCQKHQQKSMKYFTKFFSHLKQKSEQLYHEIKKLSEANDKLREWNEPNLLKMETKIIKFVESSQKILGTINIEDGPILHKYKLIKGQLQNNYKTLEEQISYIQEFQGIYITHTNRIKKILLISILNYLHYQKQLLNFGQINEKMVSDGENYDINEEDLMMEQTTREGGEKDLTNQLEIDKGDTLQTGFRLSAPYLALLNRFLFVAYTEWKDSQFFKKTLTQELYVMLNIDPNDSFARIDVNDMDFEGDPPEIVWLKQLKSEQNESLFDLHISFKGKWSFKIKTTYRLFRMSVPLELTIEVEEFYCVIRLCWVPAYKGKGWFSFIGEPIPKIKTIPTIGTISIDLETSKTMFHNFLLKKLKQNTYPVKQKLPIPLSTKNQDLLLIEKRFKAMALNREF